MSTAQGQKAYHIPNAQRFSLGARIAALSALPTFRDPDLKDKFTGSVSPGTTAALLVNFNMKKGYSFQSEFGYTLTGRKVSFNDGTWINRSTYQFIDMGMLLRKSFFLKLGKNMEAMWYVNAGPNIKYWLSGTGNLEVSGSTPQHYTISFGGTPAGEYDKLYYFDTNRWLFGLDLGIGTNIGTFRGQHVAAELRLTWGQTYLGHKNSVTTQSLNILGFEDSLLCNMKMLSLSVAYTFDFYTGQQKMGKSTHQNDRKK